MSNKPWERPWTAQEIAENASNWNLGADVGLLKHLEQFSEDLLRKANTTNNNLNNLLQNLTNASLSLDIARNEFLSLSNTQFIESRVYEDDETLPTENDQHNSAEEKKENEDDRIKDMKLAVMTGLEVLDKYFDKIEVPASDSEDETDCPSFVLRPKDPYLDRPLPYVIGSEDWHKKWHVGLEESSSDSETEKVSEKFSDTDSESDLPVVNRQAKSMSESGSEADLSNRMPGVGPVANSTFNDTNKHFFGSSSSEEFNSVSAQAPISQNTFAEQLAAKLGNVAARNVELPEPEVNKRPIQKTSDIRDFGNLFLNEPPPLDDADDLFGAKSNQHGVFSGGDGLFDDLDNDVSFWGEKKDVAKQAPQAQEKTVPNLFDEEDEDDGAIFTSVVQPQPKQEEAREEKQKRIDGEQKRPSAYSEEKGKKIDIEKRPRGLFDDGDASDDDIFNTDKLKKKLESIVQQQPAGSLFDEEPPPLITNEKSDGKKIPVGGVSVLARHELKKALKTRRHSSEGSESDTQNVKREDQTKNEDRDIFSSAGKEGAPPKRKSVGLFDQGDELFDDLFSEGPQKKFSSGLFDDADDFMSAQTKPRLFESPKKQKESAPEHGRRKNDVKPLSLFDDDDGSEDDFFGISSARTKQLSPPKETDILEQSPRKEPEQNANKTGQILDGDGGDEDPMLKGNINKTGQSFDGDDESPLLKGNINKTGQSFDGDDESPLLKENATKTRQTLSLFDDDGAEEDDDLFLITPKTVKQKSDNPLLRNDSLGSEEELFKEIKEDSPSETLGQSKAASGNLFEVQTTFAQTIPEITSPDLKSEEKTATLIENDSNLFSAEGNAVADKKEEVERNLFGVSALEESGRSQEGSSLNLFDPIPPPDLENWDTRSENNLFEDDIYSFDNGPSVNGQRSSIFDVEPPSLLCNESSGIVRDQSARVETDDSSFFPYASSSRRLSTDLSHEDDSIFVTKTKNIIDSKLLHDIPEVSPQTSDESFTSAVDLTPSGNVDDLYSEATTFTESLSRVSVTGKTKEDDVEEKLEKKPPIPSKIKPQVQPIQDTKEGKEDKPKDGGPGKLKHNLNINVRALLPGAPLHRRSLEKSKSLDLSGDSEHQVDAETASDDLLKNSRSNEASHSESSLYNPEGSVEVLQSITKDRARIPIRRRPSTKKGREAIRKSCIDFSGLEQHGSTQAEEEEDVPKLTPPSFPAELTKKLAETDVVGQPMDVPNKPGGDDQPAIVISDLEKEETIQLEPDKNLLIPNFSGERRTSFVKTDNFESPDFKKSDLFDDEEDNGDDIFSTKKLPPKSDMFKRSLFEDDDDDAEDIFGTPSAVTAKVGGDFKSSTSRRPNKTSILKKLENTEVIFDPLDALNNQ